MKFEPIDLNESGDLYGKGPRPGAAKCTICHRALSDPDSIAIGMGPVCARKNLKEHGMSSGGVHQYADVYFAEPIRPSGVVFYRTMPIDVPSSEVVTNVPHLFWSGSPDGFEWGYAGSGPSDFAWNICEWFLRHLEWEGEKEKVHSGDEVFILARRFKYEVRDRWIACAPAEGDTIPYLDLRGFFEGGLANLKEFGYLPWETKAQGYHANLAELYAKAERTGAWDIVENDSADRDTILINEFAKQAKK